MTAVDLATTIHTMVQIYNVATKKNIIYDHKHIGKLNIARTMKLSHTVQRYCYSRGLIVHDDMGMI
jgi:hypothetical protein